MKLAYKTVFPIFLLFYAFNQSFLAQKTEVSPINFCDLVTSPAKYDGREVSVFATFRYGIEVAEIYCLGCTDQGQTYLEIPDGIEQKSSKILRKFPDDGGTVNAFFTGTFKSGGGFGHLNGYRFKFVLRKIVKAKVLKKWGYPPSQLPEKIRKKVCGGKSKLKKKC